MSKKPTGKPAAKSGKPPAVPARKTEVRKAAAPPKKAVAAPPSSGKAKSQPAKDVPKAVKTGKQASAAIAKPVVKAASKPEPAAKAAQPVKPAPARTMAISKPEQTKKTPEGSKKMAPRPKVSEIVLPPGYRPSESEPFMNPMHRAYFRKRLLDWKDEILRQTRETLAILSLLPLMTRSMAVWRSAILAAVSMPVSPLDVVTQSLIDKCEPSGSNNILTD